MFCFCTVLVLASMLLVDSLDITKTPAMDLTQAIRRCDSQVGVNEVHLCAIERIRMITDKGDAMNSLNETVFGPYYLSLAKSCFTFQNRPKTPDEATQFAKCFLEKSRKAERDDMSECVKKFPQDDVSRETDYKKKIEASKSFACFVSCTAETKFLESDNTVDLSAMKPQFAFAFDTGKVADECENEFHKKYPGDTCRLRAGIVMCLSNAFAEAARKHFANYNK